MTDFADRLQSIPGVSAVGGAAAGSPPLVMAGFPGGGASRTRLQLPNAPAAEFVAAEWNRVSPGYFSAAAIPLLRGRVFGVAEAGAWSAVVLDERAAKQLFGDSDPVGREVIAFGKPATVIGLVANVRTRGPETDSGARAYFPGPPTAGSYAYLIRTSRPPATLIPAVEAAIAGLRPAGSKPVLIRRIEDAFRNITARRRFSAVSMAIFGALALMIGATGVYGVMSSLVAQRTREIGVRLALGATASRIVRAVLGPMARYVGLGLVLGLPIAWLVTRTSAALFFQVRPTDAWVYLVVAAVLGTVGLTAALVPARRASRVDPLTALRAE